MNFDIFQHKKLEEKLILFEELKNNYVFKNHKENETDKLANYIAIGVRNYFPLNQEQSRLSILAPLTKTLEQQITEQIIYFTNNELENPQKNPDFFEYNKIITATQTFHRTTKYQTELIRTLGRVPKNKITDTNHEVTFKVKEMPRGKINLKNLQDTEFIYYLTNPQIEKIYKHIK